MLKGQSAIVTGSTSGIGLSVAEALARAGASVMLNGFGNAKEIEQIRAKLEGDTGVSVAYSDVHRSVASAAHLNTEDVVIAVSHSGRTAEVLDPVRVAKQRGATVLAITNYPRSPLAEMVDIVLSSAGRESIFFRTGATVSLTQGEFATGGVAQ